MKNKTNKKFLKHKEGFTLIEILVSLTLFTTIMIITISSVISINDANNKTQHVRAVIDNIHFAVENISRSLRTGSSYHCNNDIVVFPSGVQDCAVLGGNSIAFNSSIGDQVIYKLQNNKIKKSVNGGVFLDITSPEINIEKLVFYVEGSPLGDGKQPRALVVVKGSVVGKNNLTTEFNLQTTISQRAIDS